MVAMAARVVVVAMAVPPGGGGGDGGPGGGAKAARLNSKLKPIEFNKKLRILKKMEGKLRKTRQMTQTLKLLQRMATTMLIQIPVIRK